MKKFVCFSFCISFLLLHVTFGSLSVLYAQNLKEVTSYYVRADGNDKNDGLSEKKPFKTLTKAIEMATKSKVKKITIIGSLAGQTKINNSGKTEILITGKPNASDNEKAILTASSSDLRKDPILISGTSNIKFEYLTITGYASRGIWVEESKAILTISNGVVITKGEVKDDVVVEYGGGILMQGGTLIMQGDALVTGNHASYGGGIAIEGTTFIMKDQAAVKGNEGFDVGGGIIIIESELILQGNSSITKNIAKRGGGVFIEEGTMIMEDNASIKNNESTMNREGRGGGGVAVVEGTLTMKGSSSISENKAVSGGGVHVNEGTLTMENNSTIKNNESTGGMLNGGGGICLFWEGEAILKDNSLVTENKAEYGGGVFTKSFDLKFSGGSIDEKDDYTFQTGNIRGNSAKRGPDVYRNMR